MKLFKLFIVLFVFQSQVSVAQISKTELQSSGAISFITEMIKDENNIYGEVSKSDNDSWSIKAEKDEKVSSFMFSSPIFIYQHSDLDIGLKKTINYLMTKGKTCYEYLINQEDGKWGFYVYECNKN